LSWDSVITADFDVVIDVAKNELCYWSENLVLKNCRSILLPVPDVVAWVDASDFAIGGVAAKVVKDGKVPVTADNWLLDSNGAYRRLSNCAQLQVANLPWSAGKEIDTRDEYDLDPIKVKKLYYCHRNLKYFERAADSNERELIAAVNLLESCGRLFNNSVMTLHFDNMNAATICRKGSPKIRLQKYAEKIANIACENSLKINPVWIPRDLNNVADMISKTIDYEDYGVTEAFFRDVCEFFGVEPQIDCFANAENAKTKKFFSLSYCVNSTGVDCFSYNWRHFGICWLFPPPRLIGKTLNYLKECKAKGLLLVPQWKFSYFYPMLAAVKKFTEKRAVFSGKDIFVEGADAGSFFGPRYNGNVEVIYLNYDYDM
jgi:hypothetical protein